MVLPFPADVLDHTSDLLRAAKDVAVDQQTAIIVTNGFAIARHLDHSLGQSHRLLHVFEMSGFHHSLLNTRTSMRHEESLNEP